MPKSYKMRNIVDISSVPKCCSRWPASCCCRRYRQTASRTPSTFRSATKTSTKILSHHQQRTGRKYGRVTELQIIPPLHCETFVSSKGIHKYDGEIPKREARIHYPFGVTVRPNETVDSGMISCVQRWPKMGFGCEQN